MTHTKEPLPDSIVWEQSRIDNLLVQYSHCRDIDHTLQNMGITIERLQKQHDELLIALRRYGWHEPHCTKFGKGVCVCGLDLAIEKAGAVA